MAGVYTLEELRVVKDNGGGIGMVYGGNVVEAVTAGSPASQAGVRKGMVILEIAGQPVNDNTNSVAAALSAAKREFTMIAQVDGVKDTGSEQATTRGDMYEGSQSHVSRPETDSTASTARTQPSLSRNNTIEVYTPQSTFTTPDASRHGTSSSMPRGDTQRSQRSPPMAPSQRMSLRGRSRGSSAVHVQPHASQPQPPHMQSSQASTAPRFTQQQQQQQPPAHSVHSTNVSEPEPKDSATPGIEGVKRVASAYTSQPRPPASDLDDSLAVLEEADARTSQATPPGTPTNPDDGWAGGARRNLSRVSAGTPVQKSAAPPPMSRALSHMQPTPHASRAVEPVRPTHTPGDGGLQDSQHISPARRATTPNIYHVTAHRTHTPPSAAGAGQGGGGGWGAGGPEDAPESVLPPATPQQSRFTAAAGARSRMSRSPVSRGRDDGLSVGPSRRASQDGRLSRAPSHYIDEDGFPRESASPRRAARDGASQLPVSRSVSQVVPPSRQLSRVASGAPAARRATTQDGIDFDAHTSAQGSGLLMPTNQSSAPPKSSRPSRQSVTALEDVESVVSHVSPGRGQSGVFDGVDKRRIHALAPLEDEDVPMASGALQADGFDPPLSRMRTCEEDVAADDVAYLHERCAELAEQNGSLAEDLRRATCRIDVLEDQLARAVRTVDATQQALRVQRAAQDATNQRLQEQIDALMAAAGVGGAAAPGNANVDTSSPKSGAAGALGTDPNAPIVAALAQAVARQLSGVLPGVSLPADSSPRKSGRTPPQLLLNVEADVPPLASPRLLGGQRPPSFQAPLLATGGAPTPAQLPNPLADTALPTPLHSSVTQQPPASPLARAAGAPNARTISPYRSGQVQAPEAPGLARLLPSGTATAPPSQAPSTAPPSVVPAAARASLGGTPVLSGRPVSVGIGGPQVSAAPRPGPYSSPSQAQYAQGHPRAVLPAASQAYASAASPFR